MTIHSKDRKSWLTKLDRIGELSAKNKEQVFNNIGHIIDADMLKEQYRLLDAKKAVGIDKVTKTSYGVSLDNNINKLIQKIRRGTYKSKPAKVTTIPKEDGSSRPLVISCFEDKLIQRAVSTILTKTYEPLFLSCSYGYRSGKNCHDALRALSKATYRYPYGTVVEIDIQKYFNTIPHNQLMELLQKKISDKRFLRLIEILITAPIQEGSKHKANTEGCPQGSILSPILSNIYLHHIIDEWFANIEQTHLRGKAELIRFADDMVFIFEQQSDAQRFYRALPKRLAKAGLTMHMNKSRLIPAGRSLALSLHQKGKRLPTFNFLGFTCYWGKSRKGFWRLKYKSRKDRFAAKLKGMRKYLRKNLNAKSTHSVCETVRKVIIGWINYHAISDNGRRIAQFIWQARRIMFWWFNRRGGNRRKSWAKLIHILEVMGLPNKWKITSMF